MTLKTSKDEGLSFIVVEDGSRMEKVSLRDAITELKGEITGDRIWTPTMHGPCIPSSSTTRALPHTCTIGRKHAKLVNQNAKPESYFYPVQNNNYGADYPYTFFGLRRGPQRDQLRQCLLNFSKGDNRITEPVHRVPSGAGHRLGRAGRHPHAPGSLCTYEPQKASDIFAMYQSLTGTRSSRKSCSGRTPLLRRWAMLTT